MNSVLNLSDGFAGIYQQRYADECSYTAVNAEYCYCVIDDDLVLNSVAQCFGHRYQVEIHKYIQTMVSSRDRGQTLPVKIPADKGTKASQDFVSQRVALASFRRYGLGSSGRMCY